MGKYISAKDSNGYSFSHTFSDDDWDAICTLDGENNKSVKFSEGSASIVDGTVFITLKKRIYDLSASDIF